MGKKRRIFALQCLWSSRGAWIKGMVGGIVDVHNMYFNSQINVVFIRSIWIVFSRAISYFKLRV
jgi:uncharacterized membrane protein